MVSYAVDYSLWKLDVRGYHLTNIFLHIFVALTIYWLINLLYLDKFLSCLTAIFFVVHPIHTEAVSYISGRSDSLGALFVLLSIIFYIKALDKEKFIFCYPVAILSYILALLSREASLIFPILLLLYHYCFKKKIKAKIIFGHLFITVLYVLLRVTVFKRLFIVPVISNNFFERSIGFFVAIFNYLKLIALPFDLHLRYETLSIDLNDPRLIIGILLTLCFLTYLFKNRKKRGLVFFSIAWFFVALVPVSNLYPLNAYMLEHWLYLPSIGAFLILAKALHFIYTKKEIRLFAICVTIGLLSFYSYLTIKQGQYWKNQIIFYRTTLRYAPGNWKLYYNLGVVYHRLGRKEEAMASYKEALRINPDNPEIHHNLDVLNGE